MSVGFIKDIAERAVKTFVQAYLAVWIAQGATWDGLFSTGETLKAAVVALVLSLAMNMGLRNVGPLKDNPSIVGLNISPKR